MMEDEIFLQIEGKAEEQSLSYTAQHCNSETLVPFVPSFSQGIHRTDLTIENTIVSRFIPHQEKR